MAKTEELRAALQEALEVFDAHDMEMDEFGALSRNCDGFDMEEKYCDCFDLAMRKVIELYNTRYYKGRA